MTHVVQDQGKTFYPQATHSWSTTSYLHRNQPEAAKHESASQNGQQKVEEAERGKEVERGEEEEERGQGEEVVMDEAVKEQVMDQDVQEEVMDQNDKTEWGGGH